MIDMVGVRFKLFDNMFATADIPLHYLNGGSSGVRTGSHGNPPAFAFRILIGLTFEESGNSNVGVLF